MSKLLGIIVSWLGIKALKIVLAVMFYTFAISFYAYVILFIVKLYNLITDFFMYIGTGADISNPVISQFFGYLNCIGFISAFNANLPLISSSLVFLLTLYLYKITKNIVKEMVNTALRLM